MWSPGLFFFPASRGPSPPPTHTLFSFFSYKREKNLFKEKKAQKKRKKALFKEEKRLKKIRAPLQPSGGPAGQFSRSNRATLVPRENARREWPSTFSMTYPFKLPRPPPAPRLAPPLQDFQGVRGQFKEGCLVQSLKPVARCEPENYNQRDAHP